MIELGCYPLALESAKSRCVNFEFPRLQFLAGRHCAQLALISNGYFHPDEVILRDERGAPLWPSGYVGSITHTGGFAAAMVATNSRIQSLGIDSEILIHRERAEKILPEIVTSSEWNRVQESGSDLNEEELAILCFSAKESVYKCMSPLLRMSFGFHSVELIQIDGAKQTFQAQLLLKQERFNPLIHGKYVFTGGMIHTMGWSLR